MKSTLIVRETKPKNDLGEYSIALQGRVDFGAGLYQSMSIWAKTTKPVKKGTKFSVADLEWEWQTYTNDLGEECKVRRMTAGTLTKVKVQ